MRKIPTLFLRDPQNMARVTREVNPAAQWVIDGEGTATRKYDGTCVMRLRGEWWARRTVKSGRETPLGWVEVERDRATGITVGWEPIHQSPYAKIHAETLAETDTTGEGLPDGTYELVGPKVNRNPERFPAHCLVPHDMAMTLTDVPRDYDGLWQWLHTHDYEGVVWHHPDGRMAKIKARDFPRD